MAVFWLDEDVLDFPPAHLAEANGLLAISNDLRPERLIVAYQNGIFPWYKHEDHFFWYSPHPRMVLLPEELIVHKSMRSIFNQRKFTYTLDTAFERVMRACAETPRGGQEGTWISEEFIEAYTELHRRGLAHSVEVWQGDDLAGGLYGLSFGRVFFGESMFARVSNASKAGLIVLTRALQGTGFQLIDCQQDTPHLRSLGARLVSRNLFLRMLREGLSAPTMAGRWRLSEDTGAIVLE
ncbi:MAG: leucyl/phenylalanyl-tRNA--protein transferase [Saprospiraceae bacterium]|nr:leucyl/phenylalanyl-tRNA--protein transferase [Saprospiraceae bacterium]MDW8228794.1 leucyl/phenylalanyl-tRNA--protein transferase [Saprospiraceae bacterium]